MKKLIILIVMVVMVLSVGGCGQQTPDYSFSAKEFVNDCFYNHGTPKDSITKACKHYENKLISLSVSGLELSGMSDGSDHVEVLVAERNGVSVWLWIKMKNKIGGEKYRKRLAAFVLFSRDHSVKIYARFKGMDFGKNALLFDFYDGEFLDEKNEPLFP